MWVLTMIELTPLTAVLLFAALVCTGILGFLIGRAMKNYLEKRE